MARIMHLFSKDQLLLVGVLLLIMTTLWWNQAHRIAIDPADTEALIAHLKHVILLPDERPVTATINNASQVKSEQAFYRDVQDGDMLIIFPTTARALIYRPSTDMIINAGPFVMQGRDTVTPVIAPSTP